MPIILAAMGEIESGGLLEFALGRLWSYFVDAYRDDFHARGENRGTVVFDSRNHITRADQERLLFGPLAGGDSNVADIVEGKLRDWARDKAIAYAPRGQPEAGSPVDQDEASDGSQARGSLTHIEAWFDGGARGNPGPAGAGAVVYACGLGPKRHIQSLADFLDARTNNEAEYEALIICLESVLELLENCDGGFPVKIFGDSLLVIQQVKKVWGVRSPNLIPLFTRASSLVAGLRAKGCNVSLTHFPRSRNGEADAQANKAMNDRDSSSERGIDYDNILIEIGEGAVRALDDCHTERITPTQLAEHPRLWEFCPVGCEDRWREATRPFFRAYLQARTELAGPHLRHFLSLV